MQGHRSLALILMIRRQNQIRLTSWDSANIVTETLESRLTQHKPVCYGILANNIQGKVFRISCMSGGDTIPHLKTLDSEDSVCLRHEAAQLSKRASTTRKKMRFSERW